LRILKENTALLIGLVVSLFIHISVLAFFLFISQEEKPPKKEEKVVYINIVHPDVKKNKTPKVKKRIPKSTYS